MENKKLGEKLEKLQKQTSSTIDLWCWTLWETFLGIYLSRMVKKPNFYTFFYTIVWFYRRYILCLTTQPQICRICFFSIKAFIFYVRFVVSLKAGHFNIIYIVEIFSIVHTTTNLSDWFFFPKNYLFHWTYFDYINWICFKGNVGGCTFCETSWMILNRDGHCL